MPVPSSASTNLKIRNKRVSLLEIACFHTVLGKLFDHKHDHPRRSAIVVIVVVTKLIHDYVDDERSMIMVCSEQKFESTGQQRDDV